MFERPSTSEGALETSSSQAGLQAALEARYALERELGRGGMATVYLARDLRHRRRVAVKVLHPELSALLGPDRFLRGSTLRPLFSICTSAVRLGLRERAAVLRIAIRRRRIAAGTAPARAAASDRRRHLPGVRGGRRARHPRAQGIIHRDIKPENILFQGGHALVAEFGVALAVQQAGGQRMTQTGLSFGTPQYMRASRLPARRP